MPKDNEVDEKAQTEELIRRLREVLGANGSGPETTLLARAQYHAATVSELRAEVERLNARIGANAELHSRNLLDMARERNAESDRADAAERRVGELKSRIQSALANVAVPKMSESRAEYFKAGARAAIAAVNDALTGVRAK